MSVHLLFRYSCYFSIVLDRDGSPYVKVTVIFNVTNALKCVSTQSESQTNRAKYSKVCVSQVIQSIQMCV